MRQLRLAGVARRESQANRGRFWQNILDSTHAWYEAQGWGKVYTIPNAYEYVPEWLWQRAAEALRARTVVYFVKGRPRGGAPLMRVKSAPDYVGSVGPWAVQFDAKEFDGTSIPYDNFSPKQIEDLNASSAGGNPYSGFMVLEKRTMNVYWLPADLVHAWHMRIKRAEKGVAKSINFSKVKDERVRLLGTCSGIRFHYAPALIHGFDEGALRAA